jgi:hypothetical protein
MGYKVKSSIHIVKANIYFILHSIRANASYSVVFTDEENEYLYDKDTALKKFRDELKKREFEYTKRTGKKLPKNTAFLLSAIVNLHQHHKLEDLKPIVEFLEKTLDTKVVSLVIHRDEGKLVNKTTGEEFYSGADFIKGEDGKLYWIDENKKIKEEVNLEEFEIVKNYHAHIEFIGLDSTGRSIKRNRLNKYYLSKLQDFVADTLKMQRGFSYYKTNKKAPKRLDVKEFKKIGVAKREGAKLARVKDLKEENKLLREELKKLGAQREDYAKLEALVKKLKEKIKQKDLTIAQMIAELEKYKRKVYSKYKYKDTDEPVPYSELAEYYKNRLDKALQEQKELEEKLQEKEKENKNLAEKLLQAENRMQELEEEIKKLKSFIMQNYTAEIYCYFCNSKGVNEFVAFELLKAEIIEDFETENGKMSIKTKEFKLSETIDKKGFKIEKENEPLSEKEIEKAILIILKVKGWDINDIRAKGSKDFVEKANKVIKKLKTELIEREENKYSKLFKSAKQESSYFKPKL